MKAVIKVVKQNWTGWVSQQPKPEETIVEINEGDSLEIVKGMGNPSAMIEKIQSDSIVLKTSNLAPKKGAGIDLRGDYSNLESVIKMGEAIKFSTQTMDSGTSYTLALTNIKP